MTARNMGQGPEGAKGTQRVEGTEGMEGMEGTPGFREAIWERMAALDIGSPYALAKRLDGRVSGGALYRYLCEGQELAADRLEVIFKVLGITLAIPAQPSAAPVPKPPDPPITSDEPASPCIRS